MLRRLVFVVALTACSNAPDSIAPTPAGSGGKGGAAAAGKGGAAAAGKGGSGGQKPDDKDAGDSESDGGED